MQLDKINQPLFGKCTTPFNTLAELANIAVIALCIFAIYPKRHSKIALLSIAALLLTSTINLISITAYRTNPLEELAKKIDDAATAFLNIFKT